MSDIDSLMQKVEHRPFPLPDKPWVMQQSWSKLLFAHWPLNPDTLRRHIPDCLDLDSYEGFSWIGVVPFAMRKVHPRYTPETPWLSNFLELNLRTYVSKNGIPGVYFFSLDCSNPVAVFIARKFYHLPYFNAKMALSINGSEINYLSRRAGSDIIFDGSYKAQGPVIESSPGSIEAFLTERYCLYTTDRIGNCYQGVIHHDKWPLQKAEAEIRTNSLAEQLGIVLPSIEPLLHYSENIDTIEWALSRLS